MAKVITTDAAAFTAFTQATQHAQSRANAAEAERAATEAARLALPTQVAAVTGPAVAAVQGAISQAQQAAQQAVSAAAITDTLPAESALAGRVAGTYQVTDTGELLTWDGSAVTARQPMLPTIQTSVARVADIPALRAYSGAATTIAVSDPLRGGTFVRALRAVAGQPDYGTRHAHADPLYVWQRLSSPFEVRVDWFIDPDLGHSESIQRAIDATPTNGTLIGGRKRAGAFAGNYVLYPWARPDGRTDVVLTIDRPMTVDWNGSEFAGSIAYDNIPSGVNILEISGRGIVDGGARRAYRFRGLAIMPQQFNLKCGGHVVVMHAEGGNNLANITFEGGQLVTYDRDYRAMYSNNSGEDGMFGFRMNFMDIVGGIKLLKLGDSCEIVGGFHGGKAPAFEITMLTPADPMNASSQFLLDRPNINVLARMLILRDASTFIIRGVNGETRNMHEGQTEPGTACVELENCGTPMGISGISAREWSGSLIQANKFLPAQGGSYSTSSNQSGFKATNCRGFKLELGAIGSTQIFNAQNVEVGSGVCAEFVGCLDFVVDMPDLQIAPNAVPLRIDAACKNARYRGATFNLTYEGAAKTVLDVVDAGQGTMGIPRALPLAAGFITKGGGAARMVKGEDGVVQVWGTLTRTAGPGLIGGFTTLAELPPGFRPVERVEGGADVLRGEYYAGQADRPYLQRVLTDIVAGDQGEAAGRVRLNPLASAYDESLPDVRQISLSLTFQAPPVP